ncbi:hypothetical protein ACFLZ4_01840 [Patescibacteria group bacterium]
MIYKVTGTNREGALSLMAKALPVLRSHGAPTDISTCEFSLDAVVVGPEGKPLMDAGNITFGFPAFDVLRCERDLHEIVDELSKTLGVPCYTLDAAVFAGFP